MDRERRVPAGRIQTDTDAAEYGGGGRWGVGLVDVLVVLGLGRLKDARAEVRCRSMVS